jgi:fibronectin-binding autotransporter adhesin
MDKKGNARGRRNGLDNQKCFGLYGGFDGNASRRDERSSDASLTVIDGGTTIQIIHITDGSLLVDGITFSNGNGFNGGAIFVDNSSSLTVKNCRFSDNSGGAISHQSDGTTTISGTQFVRNDSSSGGAVYCASGTVNISDCVFGTKGQPGDRNEADISGGAVSGGSGCTLRILRSYFYYNRVTDSGGNGGAIYISPLKLAYIESCGFIGNEAGEGPGGAIHLSGSSITIENSVFQDNHAYGANNDGGAICSVGGPELIIRNTDISGNTCTNNGGGVYAVGTNLLSITGGSITGNTATVDGDQVYTAGSTGNITNCVIGADPNPRDFVISGLVIID